MGKCTLCGKDTEVFPFAGVEACRNCIEKQDNSYEIKKDNPQVSKLNQGEGIIIKVLMVFGGLAILGGLIIFGGAKSAIHEIEGLLFFLIAAVLFSSSAIINSIDNKNNNTSKVEHDAKTSENA